MPHTISFYQKSNGQEPAKDFILSLDFKMRARVFRLLKLLHENGNNLREPYSRHLDDEIFELRIQAGPDISRILYFFFIGSRIILTNGFIKKTQRTPRSEIELARKYRQDFLEREEGDND